MDNVEAKLFGTDLFGAPLAPKSGGLMAEKFVVPPFSVLNAREGSWQERKRAWLSIGISGGEGRDAAPGGGAWPACDYSNGERGGGDGKPLKLGCDETRVDVLGKDGKDRCEDYGYTGGKDAWGGASGSIFDPVLCELMFRWFCPKGGQVLDPFGGESTKGIVSTVLGFKYLGIEVRQEQVDANYAQAKKVGVTPEWVCGDSKKAESILPEGFKADMVFTSPPYFDLEVYSDSGADGSAFRYYHRFMEWYQDIFRQCVERLKNNRFLVVKVGEIRDDKGVYRNFVGDNITCFRNLGLHYYNEIILVTAVGSLPVRAGRAFSSGRKVGKTHQNLLCFYKGNPERIKDEFKELA